MLSETKVMSRLHKYFDPCRIVDVNVSVHTGTKFKIFHVRLPDLYATPATLCLGQNCCLLACLPACLAWLASYLSGEQHPAWQMVLYYSGMFFTLGWLVGRRTG